MRQRKDFKRKEGIRSARLVVIAAEGRFTEKIYFEAMKVSRQASDVHVEILPRDDNNSDPKNVFEQIRQFKQEYNIEDDDQLWIVIDKDRWPEETLSEIARYCAQDDNLYFCVSNPCFELWLLLHLEDVANYNETQMRKLAANKKVTARDTWLKHRIKEITGHYHESDYDAFSLLPTVDIAIKRAEKLDISPKDRWPQTVGTRVYRLARSIMGEK